MSDINKAVARLGAVAKDPVAGPGGFTAIVGVYDLRALLADHALLQKHGEEYREKIRDMYREQYAREESIDRLEASKPQPTPAIDLEQFREAVCAYRLASLAGLNDCEAHGVKGHSFGESIEHADRLLALIDGQANVRSSSEHSSALNTLARMFHNGEEMEGPDGMAVSVDIALWHEASEAFDVLIGDCEAETLADSTKAQPTKGDGQAAPRPLIARPLAEWHEDDGPAMWWAWCGSDWAGEPAWCGTPNDCDWPGYHTHWTPHPAMPMQPTKGEGE